MKNKGFTLIELLVVMAIISLLSSVVLASIKDARQKAEDKKTLTEIKSLMTALELYKNANGSYPGTPGTRASWYSTYNGGLPQTVDNTGVNFSSSLSQYISKLPTATKSVTQIYYIKDTTPNPAMYTRCSSNIKNPEYQILLNTDSPTFLNYPFYQSVDSFYNSAVDYTNYKCFSLE